MLPVGLLRTAIAIYTVSLAAAQSFLYTQDVGVIHLELPGVIPSSKAGHAGDSVLLHAFVSSRLEGDSTDIKGFFFAEAVSKYVLTPWGQCSQPASVKEWNFPVMFKPHSGEPVDAVVSSELWTRMDKEDPFAFPVPFTASLSKEVACVEVIVKGWLHTAEVCLTHNRTSLEDRVERQQAKDWSVWSVLPPFRRNDQIPAFLSTLVHYVQYHIRVGFSGSLLYANPYLMHHLLDDKDVMTLVQEGRILLLLWDRFSRYQEVIDNRTYYDVPDQIIVLNHALLAFNGIQHTSLFMGDIDEFFVPQPPVRTVQEFLQTPTCVQGQEPWHKRKKRPQPTRPWGVINLMRANYLSSITLESPTATHDAVIWKLAPRTIECNPLHTYVMATENRPVGTKALLRTDGVHSWHVHLGLLESTHAEYTGHECAFVLHVVNLWSARISRNMFVRKRGMWRRALLPGGLATKDYVAKCLKQSSNSSSV